MVFTAPLRAPDHQIDIGAHVTNPFLLKVFGRENHACSCTVLCGLCEGGLSQRPVLKHFQQVYAGLDGADWLEVPPRRQALQEMVSTNVITSSDDFQRRTHRLHSLAIKIKLAVALLVCCTL